MLYLSAAVRRVVVTIVGPARMAADVVELADFYTDLPLNVEWIEDGNSVHGDSDGRNQDA